MRIPQSPPDFDECSKEISDNNRLNEVFKLAAELRSTSKYLHWDQLRRRTPPEGYSLKEWWYALKLIRRMAYRPIPLLDKGGDIFWYFVTNSTQEKLHGFDQGIGGLIGSSDPINDPQSKDLYIVSTLMEEAITSSQLEGAATTRQIAKNMIREGRKPRDRSEQMILNNYRTMKYIAELKDLKMSPELLLKIHRMITEKTLDQPDAAGRLRNPDDNINVTDMENNVLHSPPSAEELPERIDRFCRFANEKSPEGFIHPIIRAIILHFWLAYDHPFTDGNGRTARAVFYWAMLRYGYWLFEYISISGIILKAPARYARSFLYTETDGNDLDYFIHSQISVIERAIAELHAYIHRKQQETADLRNRLKQSVQFNHRQIALLTHAIRHPYNRYTIKGHQQSHRVAYATARADIFSLVGLGLFKKIKRGKVLVFEPELLLDERLQGLS